MAANASAASTGPTAGQILTERLWGEIVRAWEQSKEVVLLLPVSCVVEMGEDGVALLAMRCRDDLRSSLEVVPSGISGFHRFSLLPEEITIEPNPTTPIAKIATSSSSSGKSGKPPRPPNSFILYRQHHHSDVVAANPNMHNNQISQIIGRMWQGESHAVKAEWKRAADRMKLQHEKDYPDYHYQPRKSSEKKRRMSKRKASKSNNESPAVRELQKYILSSPSPPALPEVSFDADGIGNVVFDPSDSDQLHLLEEALTRDLESNGTADLLGVNDVPGILDVVPSTAQEAETRLYGLLDNAAAVNVDIREIEDSLDELLEEQFNSVAAAAVARKTQAFRGAERFQSFIDDMPQQEWATNFVDI
ncbi:hypothetical protein K461DRAFT_295749 [Myriangium duriaei CBS 260.36]|uniref:HMG box domain-containing protein n=1 Tax=Myriangium duriaei CBS 260.36 TaxID=1168546 RepID=A0A9P4J136_9PEZI|nr:hypothetical protein K461DRAFT_295749 [Myriangium duriaei CBS 260.36]